MFFWFIGSAVVIVHLVFRDPDFDHRLLILGVLLPDVVDGITGGAAVLHSLVGSVVLLVVTMLATRGRRPLRRHLLAVPIGTFLHLVVDGAFARTDVFWWPFGGWGFGDAPLPSAERTLAVNVLLELAGVALVAWCWRTFHLGDRRRRVEFARTGRLTTGAVVN